MLDLDEVTGTRVPQEALTRGVRSFLSGRGINLQNIGLDVWTRHDCPSISHELISEALRLLLDRSFHPIMVISSSGSHQVS